MYFLFLPHLIVTYNCIHNKITKYFKNSLLSLLYEQ